MPQPLDCLIVGGGAAGATAATYLARFRRSVCLADAGQSRLDRIPKSRNTPGYPDGVAGAVLRANLTEQARRFGVDWREAAVRAIKRTETGFEADTDIGTIAARTILIATGIIVLEPPIDDLDACVARGLVRYCPICDGYEVKGRRVAVLGGKLHSIEEAHFLCSFQCDVTYVPANAEAAVEGAAREKAQAHGIRVLPFQPFTLRADGDGIALMHGKAEMRFDTLYPCLGVKPNSELARLLGAACDANGAIVTDAHQRTSIDGLYAAGDVTPAIDQIAVAFGQAAIAATAIHNAYANEKQRTPGKAWGPRMSVDGD